MRWGGMPGTSRSGRRPQPAAIRALKGAKTRPHHRREPTYDKSLPAMPDFVAADPLAAAMLRSAAQAVETLRRMMRDLEEARDSAFDRLNRERRTFAVERYQWQRSAITREEWRG